MKNSILYSSFPIFYSLFASPTAHAIQNWVAKTDPALNDIANLANWPAGIATDTAIQIFSLLPAAPELWMSQDATFDRMVLGGTNIVFNLGTDRTLTLLGNGSELKLNAPNTRSYLISGTIVQTTSFVNIGQITGNSNCLFAVDGPDASLLTPGREVQIGSASNAVNCALHIRNGGTLECGPITVGNHAGSSGNRMEVENATLRAGELRLGRLKTPANTLTVTGSTVTNTGSLRCYGVENRADFGGGSRVWINGAAFGSDYADAVSNTLSVSGGCVLTATGAFNIGSSSSWNTMTVTGPGSAFIASNVTLCVGYAVGANSNTLSVTDGAYLYAFRLRIGDNGCYNTLAISNSTVRVGTDGCVFPTTVTNATGSAAVFTGKRPLLKSESNILFRRNAVLRFVIPRGGYDEPPLQTVAPSTAYIGIDPTVTIALDLTAFAKSGGGRQILARTASSFNMTTATLNALNIQIAAEHPGCSLAVEDKDLVLTTPSTGGTAITIR